MTEVILENPPPRLEYEQNSVIRVLHVDDEQGVLTTTKQILEIEDQIQVESANSVDKAIKKIEEEAFDVVISDYEMPEKDGLEFLKELRENGNNIPFILFTGKGREEVVVNALNLGVDYYINKIGKPKAVFGELAYAIKEVVKRDNEKAALIESEERFRLICQSSQDLIAIANLNAKPLWANRAWEERFGKVSEFTRSPLEMVHPEDKEMVHKAFARFLSGNKKTQDFEHRFLLESGECLNIQSTVSKLKIKEKSLLFIVAKDLTEQKNNEIKLRESEERFKIYIENSPTAVFVANQQAEYKYVNEAASRLLGYSRKELLTMSIPQTLFGYEQKIIPGFAKLLKDGHFSSEIKLKHKNGKLVYVKLNAVKLPNGKLIAFCENITKRKQVEKQLMLSELLYRMQFEEALHAIVLADAETGIIINCNEAATKLFGRKKSELVDKHQQILHPFNKIKDGFSETFTQFVHGKQGKILEDQVITKSGEIKNVEIKAKVLGFENKKIIQGIFRDVTKEIEFQNKLDASFRELALVNEKLGIVGRFVRHDVRNKLTSIANNIYLAKRNLPVDSKSKQFLEKTEKSFDEINRIFDFAHAYEQIGIEELSEVDVGQIFNEAVSLYANLGDVIVENKCKGKKVKADSLLRTLFYNLIDNSLKHGKRVTKIRLAYKNKKNNLLLIYEDNGLGILEEEKKKIFEFGFGKGTGMGLNMIKAMCKIYGWLINETGTKGNGAQFTITVPKK